MSANNKVVKLTKKGKSINFRDYLFLPKNSLAFTTLTDAQKQAIKKIEEYWINRVRNYRKWKFQKHWSYKKESISSRLDKYTFDSLKGNNNSKSIQNFVRKFLRNDQFRNKFIKILWEQFEKDPVDSRLELLEHLDFTDCKQMLIEIFPHVVSGEVYTIEKELFTFYFTFLSEFSISYTIRVGLIHFRELENQNPIGKEEIIPILEKILQLNENDRKLEVSRS